MAELERAGSVEVSGRRIAWRATGAGPPLLLAQGYAGTADDWAPDFVEALGRSFSLVMPDNQGTGASEVGDLDGLTIDSMAADLEAVLDALAIRRTSVLGFSMGGFIAQRLLARAPERVEALALLSTDPGGPAAVRAEPADWAQLVDHSGTPRERASRTISIIFPPDVAPGMDREFGDLVAEAQAALDPATLAAQERAMDEWWATAPQGDYPQPPSCLIAHGAADLVIPAANDEQLASRFPGARVEHFPASGHALPAQHPEPLATLLASQPRG